MKGVGTEGGWFREGIVDVVHSVQFWSCYLKKDVSVGSCFEEVYLIRTSDPQV